MTTMYRWNLLALVLMASTTSVTTDATAGTIEGGDPVAIMAAVDARDKGDKMSANMTMAITQDGRKKSRSLRVRTIKFEDGDRQFMLFESPADVRNIGLLSIDYKDAGKSDDQWLYLPSMRKTTRIASADKSGSFMGSDFSYSDMTRRHVSNFDYKLLEQSVQVGGEDCWLIEARGKTEKVRRETGYLKTNLWISKQKRMPLQIKAWVREGKRVKLMKFSEIKQIDGVWIATRSAARTVRNGRVESTTLVELHGIKLNDSSIRAEDFTHRRLEQGL